MITSSKPNRNPAAHRSSSIIPPTHEVIYAWRGVRWSSRTGGRGRRRDRSGEAFQAEEVDASKVVAGDDRPAIRGDSEREEIVIAVKCVRRRARPEIPHT